MTVSETNLEISTSAVVDWEPPMPPTDLIFDDGEPLESNRHRIAMNVLIRSLQQGWSDRNDFFTGGNMFVYYSSTQARNRDFRGPDFLVVLGVDSTISRQGWVVWEEDGRYPDVIVELMSPSTAEIDKNTKKDIYEQTFRTPDYFVYDPFDPNSLQGWHLDINQKYQPLALDERGWLWCQRLGLWLGTWEGTIDKETAIWLRFYDSSGNLLPLPEEAAVAEAQAATAQAQAAVAEAQAATARAEAATAQAQAADAEAQAATVRAEAATAQVQAATAQVQAANARAELLAARLRELGEDPNAV
jgi:Uma2 family endonuclease